MPGPPDLPAACAATGKRLRMAKPDEVERHTGYKIGGVPVFCHVKRIPVLLDEIVAAREWVVGGGGSDRSLLKVPVADIMRVQRPQVGRFSQGPE